VGINAETCVTGTSALPSPSSRPAGDVGEGMPSGKGKSVGEGGSVGNDPRCRLLFRAFLAGGTASSSSLGVCCAPAGTAEVGDGISVGTGISVGEEGAGPPPDTAEERGGTAAGTLSASSCTRGAGEVGDGFSVGTGMSVGEDCAGGSGCADEDIAADG